ncbi:MAG: hypothetical protein CSA65_04000 [Proteobacteria bacterium]|nr:MAG: hypothetical protein CSB49_05955 [Pseudomonadota bacterium]PIE18803.1 MAG: hypothetical protein CSA65_04000 [Pseudomonadota bacterium]
MVLALVPETAFAQVDMSTLGQAEVVDFKGFTGAGFSATPAAGQLNSNNWRITGLSDGDTTFGGGPYDSGDYAKGASTGNVSGGGVYAFQVPNGASTSVALGVQPTGSDFTPGTATLRARNATGALVTSVAFTMRFCLLNNGPRSSSLAVEYSTDDKTYQQVGNIVPLMTPEAATPNATWICNQTAGTISGLALASSGLLYIRLSSDDASGSGSRDEFGVDWISLTPQGGAASPDAGVLSDHGVGLDGNVIPVPEAGVPDANVSLDGNVIPVPDAGVPDANVSLDGNVVPVPDTGGWDTLIGDVVMPDLYEADITTDSGTTPKDSGSTPKDSGTPRKDSGTSGGDDDGGCSVSGHTTAPNLAWLSLLLLVALRRRHS